MAVALAQRALLLTAVAAVAALAAGAAVAPGDCPASTHPACSVWPSDADALSDRDLCRTCLRDQGLRWDAVADAEVVWNRNHTARFGDALSAEALPAETCRLWAKACSLRAVAAAAFAGAPCLRRLFLPDNAIEALPADAFAPHARLLHLDLKRNRVRPPPHRPLLQLRSLRILDLSYNDIARLYPETFVGTPDLSILLLRGNRIRTLQNETFNSLSRLEMLDVNDNLLTTVGFSSHLRIKCLLAGKNNFNNLFWDLMKFNSSVVVGLSQSVCCCKCSYCIHSASQWISKCERCGVNSTTEMSEASARAVAGDASPSSSSAEEVITWSASTGPPLPDSTPQHRQRDEGQPVEVAMVASYPVVKSEPKDKLQTQTANITVILLTSVFSFLILLQSSVIFFLLIKSPRRSPRVVLRVVEAEDLNFPNERVTDLDEVSCSRQSLNPVYETIQE